MKIKLIDRYGLKLWVHVVAWIVIGLTVSGLTILLFG